jgi:hypothetical protein
MRVVGEDMKDPQTRPIMFRLAETPETSKLFEMTTQKQSCSTVRKKQVGLRALTWCWCCLLIGSMAISRADTAISQERLGKFELSRHRGARGLRPENTCLRFQGAIYRREHL